MQLGFVDASQGPFRVALGLMHRRKNVAFRSIIGERQQVGGAFTPDCCCSLNAAVAVLLSAPMCLNISSLVSVANARIYAGMRKFPNKIAQLTIDVGFRQVF